ncbi:expressed unknown protein [Ectocarpus siliculosus]|uniref:Ribosomal protein mS38 C-terminal domain-containing protein n=1 Tax=Ectocarpus siliculosus TaxID=2880 RepID=D8LMF8_ECTSI|nr:expressed unknown protein [Ectocarpus siliculosus]|eukprot:CBN77568.1 expressed unknown protein [Ectocarpus siliculosus]
MFSLPGRQARRLPGMGASVYRTVECYQMLGYSRLFGTSDLCAFDDSRRTWVEGGEVDKGTAQKLAAAGQMWRWTSPTGTWEGSALSIKVCEAVQGLKQATAGLLQHWASPLALSGAFPFVLPGVGRPALLPQSPEHDQGCEEDEDEEEEGVDLMGGLFEGGVWATSVKRKRVTKMRKHKWRKRRKLQRQSASRNK